MQYVVSVAVLLFSLSLNAQSDLPSIENLDTGWNTVTTDGVCSAETPYQFYVKPSFTSNKLLVFFNGGSGCWFGEACDLAPQAIQ